jgi:hypothetical protein
VYGILFYNTPSDTLTGLRNRMSICFLIPLLATLLPYVSVSLYTNDKKVYLADSSAKLYRPWAYYASKVGACQWCHHDRCWLYHNLARDAAADVMAFLLT